MRLDRLPYLHRDFLHGSIDGCMNRGLHFHGFEHEQAVAFVHRFARFDVQQRHRTGNRRADLAGLVGIRFAARLQFLLQRLVAHFHFTRLAVELEEHGSHSIGAGLADGQ